MHSSTHRLSFRSTHCPLLFTPLIHSLSSFRTNPLQISPPPAIHWHWTFSTFFYPPFSFLPFSALAFLLFSTCSRFWPPSLSIFSGSPAPQRLIWTISSPFRFSRRHFLSFWPPPILPSTRGWEYHFSNASRCSFIIFFIVCYTINQSLVQLINI